MLASQQYDFYPYCYGTLLSAAVLVTIVCLAVVILRSPLLMKKVDHLHAVILRYCPFFTFVGWCVVHDRFDADDSGELDFHEFLDLRESMKVQAMQAAKAAAAKKRRKSRRNNRRR